MKTPYATPTLERFGTFRELTRLWLLQGPGCGPHLPPEHPDACARTS